MKTSDWKAPIPMLGGGEPFFGHAREFAEHRLPFLERAAKEGGDICRLRFFGKEFLFIDGPRLLQEILVEQPSAFEKSFGMRTSLYPITGEGLFTSGGDLWRRQRKLMSPLFRPAAVMPFGDAMADCARRVISGWKEGDTVDLSLEMIRITMAAAGRVLFDLDMLDETPELAHALTTALDWTSFAMASFPLIVQQQLQAFVDDPAQFPAPLRGVVARLREAVRYPLLVPGRRTRDLRAALRLLDGRVQKMIDDRRAAGSARADLLAKLLAARDEDDGSTMSDRQVRDEVLTLFTAGHETTAASLAWTLRLFTEHPDARSRVEAEIADLPPARDWARDLARLPFTLRVVKESLRLYPPVYVFTRRAVRDVRILGYDFPRGIEILMSPFTTHRRAREWTDPLRFDPDRFLPEAEEARERCAYLPFSAGPRVCIGQLFALVEAQIILAEALSSVSLTLVDPAGVTPAAGTTLRPAGLLARVSRRCSR